MEFDIFEILMRRGIAASRARGISEKGIAGEAGWLSEKFVDFGRFWWQSG